MGLVQLMTEIPDLPSLVVAACPACGGDGYALALEGGRRDLYGVDLPSETAVACGACGGSGTLEVCACCLEPPTLRGGLEVCGCAALTCVVSELVRAA